MIRHSEHAVERIEAALEAFRRGKMIILVDDEDRENEGDLVRRGREGDARGHQLHGQARPRPDLPALTEEKVDALRAAAHGQPEGQNTSSFGTAFTVSIEAARGRHHRHLGPRPGHDDPHGGGRRRASRRTWCTPGHVFPLRAREGGVLVRAGQTEGSVDLCPPRRPQAGRGDLRDHERRRHDGAHARPRGVRPGSHGSPIASVADLIAYRLHRERWSPGGRRRRSPPQSGNFRAIAYENDVDSPTSTWPCVKGAVASPTSRCWSASTPSA